MPDKRRGKRRGRIGLLIGIMALLGAILVPGGAASSAPVRAEVGVLRLHLDTDGKYFRFDTRAGTSYTQGAAQSINGSCPVTSLSGPSWVDLTGGSTSFSLNQVGLKDNGLGVRFLNCGRVDAPNWALRVKLGTGIDAPGVGIDRAELDLQGFSNATAVADLFLDGTKVDTVTQAISGSGTRARMVIDRTGKSIFDEIRLHPKNLLTSLALRGGGAGSPAASTLGSALGTNDTLFRVVSESNLTVTKTPVNPQVSAGDPAAFDIKVTNSSTGAASSVGVSDTLPAGLIWSIASQTASACSIASGVLTCTIPSLPGGASYSVRVSAQVLTPQDVTNQQVAVSLNSSVVATAGPATVQVQAGPPDSVTFTTQPTDTLFDDCIKNPGCGGSGGVVVEVKDDQENHVADGTIVTMSIGNDPTEEAKLSGGDTVSQPTVGGFATFSNLSIDLTSSGYTLIAEAGNNPVVSEESDVFAITNTDSSCTDDCTATFPNGTSTVSAPAGTVLVIETNQLTCANVGDNFLAGTVKIVPPPGPDAIDVTFQDFFGPDPLPPVNFTGPFPFCKTLIDPDTLEETAHDVPLCSQVGGAVPCVTETIEFTGPNTATLTSVLHMDSNDPHAKH